MTPYYDVDGITIYCGDCLEVVEFLNLSSDIDTITDPPYGIKRFKKGFGYTRFKGYGAEKTGIIWDKKPTKKTIDKILNIGRYHIIWGANNFELPASESFLVWNKLQTVDNFAMAELAYCDIPNLPAKIFEYGIHKHNQRVRNHPTEKPLQLIRWCIDLFPDKNNAIFDPFMGSGTTLVAAQNEGRRAVGIEISEEYCKIAVDRLRQKSLFSIIKPEVKPEAEQLKLDE